MSAREHLPNRRGLEISEFASQGIPYRLGVGRYADGRAAEVFLDASVKSGSAVQAQARDIAVLLSIALQHGVPIEAIRGAVTREEDGSPAGPLGVIVDGLAVLRLHNILAADTSARVVSDDGHAMTLSRPDDPTIVARLQGFEGEPCRDCGNFTMVRNGTCLKCNTCGSTSGCS